MLQGYFDDDGRPMLEAVVKLHDYGIRAVPSVVDTGADNRAESPLEAARHRATTTASADMRGVSRRIETLETARVSSSADARRHKLTGAPSGSTSPFQG